MEPFPWLAASTLCGSGRGSKGRGFGFTSGTDRDDSDPATYPGAPELGAGKDNDCAGTVDEGISSTTTSQAGSAVMIAVRGEC